jgi:hypothetical protein
MRRDALLPNRKVITGFLLSLILPASALAADTNAESAVPGTINYVEGQVEIGTETLNSQLVGTAQLQTNQSLTTENGKAEILLTPGVFLRVGHDSSVKMISPRFADTEVELQKGHAIIEVTERDPRNKLHIAEGRASTFLSEPGLYDFNLNQKELRVFEGQAIVGTGEKPISVKAGREVSVDSGEQLEMQQFNKKVYEDEDLYRWSSLRSGYLAEANIDAAGLYAKKGSRSWRAVSRGGDWSWDPSFGVFTFVPSDAMGISYSTFGWGFYSPGWVFKAPFHIGCYHHQFSTNVQNWGPGSHYVEGHNYANGIYDGPG